MGRYFLDGSVICIQGSNSMKGEKPPAVEGGYAGYLTKRIALDLSVPSSINPVYM